LPELVVLRSHEWDAPIVPLLDVEISKVEPGQQAMLDRLLDLLLIAFLRAWFSRSDTQVPRWYQASSDAVVGPALRMLQNNPAQPWTVAVLAREIGVSRANLARKFTELVGEPPMTYLTNWRLTLAADLLKEDGSTIGAIASEVGYGSPFSLSTAFKRVWGMSPAQYRSTVAAGATKPHANQ
jgi:AraC-like DNA-binding protein